MILPKNNRLSSEEVAQLSAIVAEFGCRIQPIVGDVRTIYAIVGDERHELMISRLEGLPFVDRVDTIQSPHKLMDIKSDLARHRVKVGTVTLGDELLIMAGHCTIDPKNPNLFYETAQAVKEAGAHALRGGVWKPRTNPYAFQGDDKSLDILMEGSRRTGLPVDTEVMDEEQLRLALAAGVQILQIGARNALNYSLLRQVGAAIAGKPTAVLLKRGMHTGTLNEFISAAEYIVNFGNPNVILCPRGTQPGLDGYQRDLRTEQRPHIDAARPQVLHRPVEGMCGAERTNVIELARHDAVGREQHALGRQRADPARCARPCAPLSGRSSARRGCRRLRCRRRPNPRAAQSGRLR